MGIIFSVVFIYLSFKGADYNNILEGLKNLRLFYLLPASILLFSQLPIRSIRLGLLLNPTEKLNQRLLFPISCIGYMAITILPIRIGELVRPFLIKTKSNVPFSSAFAAIVVDKFFDLFSLLCILFCIILTSSFPPWIIRGGLGLLFTFVIFFLFMLILYFRTDQCLRLVRPLFKKISEKNRSRIEDLVYNFVKGFKIISNPRMILYVLFLSLLNLLLCGLSVFSLFSLYNFDLSYTNALLVFIITIIGINLPTAPGFMGNFQFSCIMALNIFNISKDEALSFSMIYYFLVIGILILSGLFSLPFLKLSIKDIIQQIKKDINLNFDK